MDKSYEERNEDIFYDKTRYNMTYKEIADKYGISLSRVYQILKRAKEKKKKEMEKVYRSWDPGRTLSIDEYHNYFK